MKAFFPFDTSEQAMEFLGSDREWHITRNGYHDEHTLYGSPATTEYSIAHNPRRSA